MCTKDIDDQSSGNATMIRSILQTLILWSLLVAGLAPLANGEPAYRGKVFLGMGGPSVPLPESDAYGSKFGIKLERVPIGSTADKAGLKVGDIVASIDGSEWADEQIRLSQSFGKAGDKAVPGEMVRLLVLRGWAPDRMPNLEVIDLPLATYPRTAEEQPHTPTNADIRPDLETHAADYEELCLRLIDRFELRDDCDDLLERIDRTQRFPDPDRLALVRYVHRDPFKQEVVSRELIDAIEARDRADRRFWIGHARSVLFFGDVGAAKVVTVPPFEGGDLEAHLDYIVAILQIAAELNGQAFAALDEAAVETILTHQSGLFDAFIDFKMLSYDDDRRRQAG